MVTYAYKIENLRPAWARKPTWAMRPAWAIKQALSQTRKMQSGVCEASLWMAGLRRFHSWALDSLCPLLSCHWRYRVETGPGQTSNSSLTLGKLVYFTCHWGRTGLDSGFPSKAAAVVPLSLTLWGMPHWQGAPSP